MAIDEWQAHKIATVIDEKVENEIADSLRLAPGMLQKIEIRASGVVKGNDFSINNSVFRKVTQGIENLLVLSVERLPPSGIQAQLASGVDCESSIAV